MCRPNFMASIFHLLQAIEPNAPETTATTILSRPNIRAALN